MAIVSYQLGDGWIAGLGVDRVGKLSPMGRTRRCQGDGYWESSEHTGAALIDGFGELC